MREQALTFDLKIAKDTLEKRNRTINHDLTEIKERMRDIQETKLEMQRELEIIRRERNFMSESLRELKNMLMK